MLRKPVVGVLCLLCVAAAQAHGQTTIAWKLKEGEKLIVELSDTEKFSLAAFAQEIKNEQTTLATLTIEKKNADGSWVISQKIDAIKAQGGGQAAMRLDKVFKEVEGCVVKVILNSDYQMQKVEGIDELTKKVTESAELPPQFIPYAKTFITGLVVKPTERVFGFKLPDKAVNKGDKWSQKLAATVGPLGKTTVVNNYVYEGAEGGKEKIVFTPEIKFSPEDAKPAGSPLTVKKADLKAEKAKGTILFDNDAGKLTQNDSEMRLKGTVTISAMNQDFPLDIDLEVTNKTRLLDKAP